MTGRIQIDARGCWLWTGKTTQRGYAEMRVNGKIMKVHRLTYMILFGQIHGKHELDHLCRVHSCVNPAHLEAVPHVVNVRRGRLGATSRARQLAKTHCPRGHAYSPENTYHQKGGSRACRTCHRPGTVRPA